MADDDTDLVSQVQVTGTDEAGAKLKVYGDTGAAAFDKIAASAAASAGVVGKASGSIEKDATEAGVALEGVGASAQTASAGATSLAALTKEARGLGTEIRKTVKDVAQFAARVTGIVAAATAAGGALLLMAGNAAKSVSTTTSAFEQNNKAQQDAVATGLSAAQASIQYGAQQKALNQQLVAGTITYDQYSDTLKKNRQDYVNQIAVTRQLQAVQEDAQKDTEKLQQTLANQKAFSALQDKFGSAASSIVQLGNQVNTLHGQFVQAFGPAISGLLDTILASLNTNGAAISQFFSDAAAKISAFIQANGPQIQQAFASIGTGVAAVFNGLINALPTLLDLFNNQLVPAFRSIAAFADQLTTAFNKLFGTNISTGAAVVVTILTFITGGFKTLFALIPTGITLFKLIAAAFTEAGLFLTPLGAAFLIVGAALLILNTDWVKFGTNLQIIGNAVVGFFQALPGYIAAPFVALWGLLTSGFQTAVDTVTDLFNRFVNFLVGLPAQIVVGFVKLGSDIAQAFSDGLDKVKGFFTDLYTWAISKIQPIIDLLKQAWALLQSVTGGGGDSTTAQSNAKGGLIRGKGTGTSDSILSWLSHKEFVVQAKRVRQYGVGFMRAINNGTLNLADMIPGYANGGLVGARLAPISAPPNSTSIARTLRPIALTIGERTFGEMFAPEHVADSLVSFATTKQVRSAGRRPTWKG